MEIAGSKILVTGASSGIGAALGPVLAARGATVGLVARRADRLEQVRAQCDSAGRDGGGSAVVWPADLGDLDRARTLAADVLAAWGTVDCIVNNAAIPKRVRATDLTMAELDETMRVNFLSPAQLTLALLPHWLERKAGLIVNVSSMGGRLAIANESAYNASKFALAGFSEALRIDLEGTGVGIKLILPGPIDTEIWDQPGNVAALFEIDKVSAADCAIEIADAIAGDGFEYYTPPIFPGGLDAKAMVVDKTANCDQYMAGMAMFAASLR